MNTLKNFFTKPSPLLHELSLYNNTGQQPQNNVSQCDDEQQWATKAIEHLMKKLRREKGKLDDLEFAIANPTLRSKCVTIPRSMDGRLQVSHRKNLPHVIYCKVWRWKDIASHHELRPVPYCQYPFQTTKQHQQHQQQPPQFGSASSTVPVSPTSPSTPTSANVDLGEVCINPYHYERVENSGFQPIFVPHNPSFMPSRWHPYSMPPPPMRHLNLADSHHHVPGNNNAQALVHSGPNTYTDYLMRSPTLTHTSVSAVFGDESTLSAQQRQFALPPPCSPPDDGSSSNLNISSPAPSFLSINSPTSPYSANSPTSPQYPQQQKMITCNTNDNNNMDVDMMPAQHAEAHQHHQNMHYRPQVHNVMVPSFAIAVPLVKMDYWCKVLHYELQRIIGKPFLKSGHSIVIDDNTRAKNDDNPGHIGIGTVFVHTSPGKAAARRTIARGIQLTKTPTSAVLLKNLAEVGTEDYVYVQARLGNRAKSFKENTVVKVLPSCEIEIFDYGQFRQCLIDTVNERSDRGFERCFELENACKIRLSFGSHWGNYRSDITSCPCWIEILMPEPLLWLDSVLQQLDSPQSRISSQS